MTVSYFYRKPAGFYSIERVFDTVEKAMPPHVSIQRFYCRFGQGILGCFRNMLSARPRQSEINHITGDVYYIALALDRRRTILTIHDLGSIKFRAGWRRELVRLLWFEWPSRWAGAITTISEATRDDVLRFTSCPASKITVIPNPLPSGFAPAPKGFGVEEPSLLQIGTSPCKNFENTVRALVGIPCRLTIIGRLSDEQKTLLKACGIGYSVKSDIGDEEVLAAYHQADVILFCSIHEGFGMPVIEANATGRPVIASDIEPLRSIAGDAACLVDPYNVDSIRAGVLRVISDADYRNELVRLGFKNAARFDPRRVAQSYLDVYEKLMTSSG